ncbi:hypothetical protein BWI96_17255 [Siphonobacter sp. SORGH_AS_0500]|uniref:zeta toxin family protein n=1 Tax=Siphonobacter sp. SORGH_AS_0500 TaxID=1864824 RepID=UPI000CBABF9F|nr:zeta toxin family protein [Siphonobacter sp. SORGH_AS_0500]PKK35284.1 hypothetical protein BWI96_17255 [Siphonobacter sp. SORGH_AS_0500]
MNDFGKKYFIELFALKNDLFNGFTPSNNPVARILAGQPGAGKSKVKELLLKEEPNSVVIDVDNIRAYHPNFHEYNLKDDITSAELTHDFASKMGELMLEEAISKKYNLILDKTLSNPDHCESLLKLLKKHKYSISINMLAVPYDYSLLGIYERYIVSKKIEGYGRYTPEHVHDKAFNGLSNTLEFLKNTNGYSLKIILRNGDVVYNSPADGSNELEYWDGKKRLEAREIFAKYRQRPVDLKIQVHLIHKYRNISNYFKNRLDLISVVNERLKYYTNNIRLNLFPPQPSKSLIKRKR